MKEEKTLVNDLMEPVVPVIERFDVILTQTNKDGKQSFYSEALSIGATDLNSLSKDIANYSKETYELFVKLQAHKVKGMSKARIKMGHEMNFKITYLGDNVKLNFYIDAFGSFVRDNTVDGLANVIHNIAEYQERFGSLWARK